jgi:hypothetical protein
VILINLVFLNIPQSDSDFLLDPAESSFLSYSKEKELIYALVNNYNIPYIVI